MSLQFQFFGFEPDLDLKKTAARSLERLLDLSPYGTVPVAVLKKTEQGYDCAIDLYTQNGPLIARSSQTAATRALTHACVALHKKLAHWRKNRAPTLAPVA